MMRVMLMVVSVAFFAAHGCAQERDILDFAAKNPQSTQVQNDDRTWRTPKYGDFSLEQAVEQLKDYPQPFTVPKVISWYAKAQDGKLRAHLLSVLAASRDARAALVLGTSLKDELLDVRIAAARGLRDYFILFVVDGGSEQQTVFAQEWWEKNRARLKKQARRIQSKATPNKSSRPTPR